MRLRASYWLESSVTEVLKRQTAQPIICAMSNATVPNHGSSMATLAGSAMVPKKVEAEAALANCRALINQINAGLSAEEPFVNVSSATELLFYLERAASALKKSVSRSQERGETKIVAFNYRRR
jgi:hypothetical protein